MNNDNLSYWVWASGFYLSDEIPYELMDLDNPNYDEEKLDEFIAMNKSADFKDWDVDTLWYHIELLAVSARKTFTFKRAGE